MEQHKTLNPKHMNSNTACESWGQLEMFGNSRLSVSKQDSRKWQLRKRASKQGRFEIKYLL